MYSKVERGGPKPTTSAVSAYCSSHIILPRLPLIPLQVSGRGSPVSSSWGKAHPFRDT